jgi:NAD(P)-dependent dehydrogenase (short-subunit alcohol dehydrogenase family)
MTNTVSFDFAGAAVLVTGGTSGIGHAVASAFADAGAKVTVTGRKASASEYDADLDRFGYHQLETTDPGSVDAVVGALGALDVLVNNAGANFPGGRDEWEPDAYAKALSMNLAGPMRLTVGCRPLLAASTLDGGGCVINTVSMSAFRAVPIVPGYASAKAGMAALTWNLAKLWSGQGIRVNAVAPGVIETPMTAPMTAFPELLNTELSKIPMGRLGTPADVVGAVLFLASAAAAYLTGTVLAVDGGYLLS